MLRYILTPAQRYHNISTNQTLPQQLISAQLPINHLTSRSGSLTAPRTASTEKTDRSTAVFSSVVSQRVFTLNPASRDLNGYYLLNLVAEQGNLFRDH